MDRIFDDLRHGARALQRSAGFTVTAVVTIALGIAACTAMFAVVEGVLLRPLPYAEPERLVRIWSAHPQRGLAQFSVSAPDALDWEAQAHSLEVLGAFERQAALTWSDGDRPEPMLVSRVTPAIFQLLGVRPRLGHIFAPADGERALVLGDALWKRRFGGDAAVVGRALTLDGELYVVTGVMPARFIVPGSSAEAWAPLELRAGDDRSRRFLRVLGRLRGGVAVETARTELDTIASRLQAQHPGTNGGWQVTVRTVRDTIVGPPLRQALLTLFGVVALVLVIACANVAHLVLSRGVARQREMAIRAALGAGRRRLLAPLLAESAWLAAMGGTLGLLVTAWMISGLRAAAPAALPRLDEVRVDGAVVAFAALASMVAAALFGLLPALQASRVEAMTRVLREGRGAVGAPAAWVRGAIVGVEVALAVVVTTGSLLLVRSLLRLQAVDPGFEAAGVTTISLSASPRGPADHAGVIGYYDTLLEAVRALPGVSEASLVSSAPFSGPNTANVVAVEGQVIDRAQAPDVDVRVAASGYFHALRIPLHRGRDFASTDGGEAPPVAIVNETMARRLWPGEDPMGRRFRLGDLARGPWITVVGLVGDALYGTLETADARPMVYLPHARAGDRTMTLVVRASLGVAPSGAALRQAIWSVDKTVPVPTVLTLDDALAAALASRRFNATLFAGFAGLAVLLAAVGVHGVMAHFVASRQPEIGLRVALGASPRAIAAFVLRRGGAAAGVGLVAGVAGSLALAPLLQALLYGVTPADPLTIMVVAGLFGALTALAAWSPARRAVRLDPVQVLREG